MVPGEKGAEIVRKMLTATVYSIPSIMILLYKAKKIEFWGQE